MSLSLYIILSVCVLIGVVFLMLSRSQKEEKTSLDPPKVRGGTLFVPTVKHHVKIAPPPIMKSRLIPEELFVDYTLPGFERKSPAGESSCGVVAEALPDAEPASETPLADPQVSEAALTPLEADAISFATDRRFAATMEAAAPPMLGFTDHVGNSFSRETDAVPFDLIFASPVITKAGVSANPDLRESALAPGENLQIKSNGRLMAFLDTEIFAHYSEIMEQVEILRDADPSRDVLIEYSRLVDKRGFPQDKKNLLMTTFNTENPQVHNEVLISETFFGENELLPGKIVTNA